jgi:MIP family channel proteins
MKGGAMSEHTRALLAEACGTFWFFFIGAGAIVTDAANDKAVGLVGVAFAHGLALSVAISSFGAISGGHFNPAVTLGLAIARKHPWDRVPTYWGAQVAGALLAGIVLRLIFDAVPAALEAKLGTPQVAGNIPLLAAIVIEALLTLFLLWAVFGTAVSPNAPKIAGFGIGLAVAADILMGGPLTGASMNPARWLGPAVASGHLRDGAVHLIGPFLGAALAGFSYLYIFGHPAEREDIEITPPRPAPASDRTQRL